MPRLFASSVYRLAADLAKYAIHDPRCQENVPVRYGERRVFSQRLVERSDQKVYPVLGMKVVAQKSPDIAASVGKVLLRRGEGWDELIEITPVAVLRDPGQCLVFVIRDQRVLRSIDSELMYSRMHL